MDENAAAEREAALAALVERLGRRLDDVAAAGAETARTVAGHDSVMGQLADAVRAMTQPAGPVPDSWLWPARRDEDGTVQPGRGPLDADRAAAVVEDLCEWLARVYLRYPGAGLPPCWAWHPDVVEELLWLRGAHADAYSGRAASWAKAGDWHERYRPGVVKRVAAAAGTCGLAQHPLADVDVPLLEEARVVADGWARRDEVPEPWPAALERAEGLAVGSRPRSRV